MAGYANIGGVWKETSAMHANIGGVQREIGQGYANIGGVWKPVFDSIPKTTNFADDTVFDYYYGGNIRNEAYYGQCYNTRNSSNIYGIMHYQNILSSTHCLLTTKKAVDLSKINSISVNCTIKDMSGGYEYNANVFLWICTQKPTSSQDPAFYRRDYYYQGTNKGTYTPTLTIDTSDLTGKFYVAIGMKHSCSTDNPDHIGGAKDEAWIHAPIIFK